MARRGNNEGTINQLPSGSWRAQIYINGSRIGKTKKTKKEAQLWLHKMLDKTALGYTGEGSNVLFENFLWSWLSQKEAGIKQSTYRLYESTIRNHIVPIIGSKKISKIEQSDIQNLYLMKKNSGVGGRTLQVIHTVINSSFNFAVRNGILISNPARFITSPRYSSPEMDFYSEDEVALLLSAVKGTDFEALLQLAVTTGLRQSELLALKWSDVDWKRNTFSIQRQLLRKFQNKEYFSSLKTQAGKRTIHLGKKTIQCLQEHKNRQIIQKKKYSVLWEDNNLVFPSSVGTPINQRNLLRRFKKILDENGLREIRFHDLRHTAASIMLNHGISPFIVAKRLGHSKVSITLDTYGHLLPGMQQESADYIDTLISHN